MLQKEHYLKRTPAQDERQHDGNDHERDASLALAHLLTARVAQLKHDQTVYDNNGHEGQKVAEKKEYRIVGFYFKVGALQHVTVVDETLI